MKRHEQNWQRFAQAALTPEEQQRLKGGHVNIPSGTGSTGLIGWDEIDIRANGGKTTGRGRDIPTDDWLFR